MKNKKEILILSALLGLFSYFTVGNDPKTSTYLVYSIVHFLAMGLLFSGQVFYLYPRFVLRNKIEYFLLYSLLLFAGLYLLTSLLYAIYIKALVAINSDTDFPVIQQMFDGPVLTETSISLGMAMLLGLVYAVIRQWVKARRFQLLKRIAQFSSLTIFLIALIFAFKYYVDVKWKGNNTIHFIENQAYQRLEEIVRQPQFKDKVVYVDLWYTSCGPCIQEFQRLPEVKESLKGKSVEYLYLAAETSMPNDKQRWKNIIRKFNLNGWHIYMSPRFADDIWEDIEENTAIKNIYPHYLLIDQQGKVVSYNAHRPREKEKIIHEIEALLD